MSAPRVQTAALLIAFGVASWAFAEWTFPSLQGLDFGMYGGDTTWYHMPFAARIAQEGSTVPLLYTDPLRLVAWFYPQSSELIHGSRHRHLQERLALAADQLGLALDRPARRLVRRPSLQGRAGDAGRLGARLLGRGDDRNPAGRGAQRRHGPRLPARLRRLPDQRAPATGAGGGRGPGHARGRCPAARQGAADHRRDRGRDRDLGEAPAAGAGRRDRGRDGRLSAVAAGG